MALQPMPQSAKPRVFGRHGLRTHCGLMNKDASLPFLELLEDVGLGRATSSNKPLCPTQLRNLEPRRANSPLKRKRHVTHGAELRNTYPIRTNDVPTTSSGKFPTPPNLFPIIASPGRPSALLRLGACRDGVRRHIDFGDRPDRCIQAVQDSGGSDVLPRRVARQGRG
jgi:hypothetical protein